MSDLYTLPVRTLAGKDTDLSAYKGHVLLIVNTASQCGFTPHYAGLETLYRQYKDQGLVVLGFPCNQFGAQEPGSAADIAAFCEKNYGVSFPLFDKVDVNGANAHPLFTLLKARRVRYRGHQMEFHEISRRSRWQSARTLRTNYHTRSAGI